MKNTPYELFKIRRPNISHLHVFGRKFFILNNDKENLSKFDEKPDEGIFIGYSLTNKAYRIYNKRTLVIEDNVKDDHVEKSGHKDEIIQQEHNQSDLLQEWRTRCDHLIDNTIGSINKGVSTRVNLKDAFLNMAFVSQIEPSKINKALEDDQWTLVMHEDLNQFKRKKVWKLEW